MAQKWEKQEGNEGVLTVTVPATEVDSALDEAFKKVSKQVSVPGFRKGKVPRQMFEKRFGVESLYQDALDILLPKAYTEAVEEAGINPVDQPEVDIEEMEKGKELVFTAKVTVEPEVKLGEYKGLEADVPDTEVTDEDVQKEIDSMLESHADMVVKDEGKVEEGDIVNLDFDGYVDGEQFEGGKAEGYDLEIGSGSFIPGFEEQVVGLENGEEKDVKVTFPEEYHAEELAGKEAVFKVKINSIKVKETPELDEDLLKELDQDVDSVEALKEKLEKDLKEAKENEADVSMKEQLIEQASDNAEIEVPEAMVKTETDRMLQEFEQRLSQQGINMEMYQQLSGQDENALRDQMKDDAEKRVRTNLVLKQIAVDENIEVAETDVDAELEKMSEQFGIKVEDIKSTLGDLSMLNEDLKVQKAIDVLVDNRKKAE
ncbi:trigger factor [Salinicoccus halodurans]|uniref:Trigger factor n=1 Tax=Salinicoccus halodurans TaxID=407035 RepID=A0A0F7D4G2_9STAP|nr:trigger factor [Salinicoccus halodurans]AKG74180.1 trigger factor [Salinicoccus halodurans]SFK61588.1 trigger factor [Salinicoccus halodurans]